ncbi:MAG: phosphatidylglycerophosphatase A family protein [bacterium]
MRLLKIALLTGCGLGYLPVAPATFGCLISIIIWYFFVDYRLIYFAIFVTLFLWGLIISNEYTKKWGDDPRHIVIDEYTALLLPLSIVSKHFGHLIIAFILFRIFDVLKPFPLRQLERLAGAWGIMLDDLGAAIYTIIIYAIIFRTFL